MMQAGADTSVAAYEGLVRSTAARYEPFMDDDFDDIAQVLRVKVWKALLGYDPSRSRLSEKNFVFGCLRNAVKDLLKSQDRRNTARGGSLDFIEGVPESGREGFELRYLAADSDTVYAAAEDEVLRLPSTLTVLERAVVHLLLVDPDYSQTEMARLLSVSRRRVQAARRAVEEKMEDWRPSVDSRPAPRVPVAA